MHSLEIDKTEYLPGHCKSRAKATNLAKISRDDTFMWLKDRQAMITFMKNFPDLRVGLLWDEEVTNSKA